MPLAMPQPDFEPNLRLHLSAFHARMELTPDRLAGPGDDDEDDDPVGDHPARRARQMLIADGDRRYK